MQRFFWIAFLAVPLCAQSSTILGNWQGTLDAGTAKLRLAFHISANDTGGMTTTLDSLDQNAPGIPVEETIQAGDKLTMKMASLKAAFEGTVNAAGTEIAGTFTQGIAFPLTLRRQETIAALRRPQTPQAPFPYESVEVVFESRGARLAGTLTLPRGKGPFPAAVLISGSGPQDRDETLFGHKPFWVIADTLSRHGIAVLRVDDRGVGGSAGASVDQTIDDMAADVLSSVAHLKSRSGIDAKRIGVIGHSEGGLVGPLAATRSSDIAYVVLLAGPGVPGTDLLRTQAEMARKAAGDTSGAMAVEGRIQNLVFAALKSESDPAAARQKMREEWLRLRASLPEQARQTVSSPAMDARMESEFARATSPELRSIILSDPMQNLRKLKVPVLALNGERDIQVSPQQNIPAIVAALGAGGNTDYTVAVLPGLNHLFQTCRLCTLTEYGDLEETFSPAALEVLTSWITGHTRSQ